MISGRQVLIACAGLTALIATRVWADCPMERVATTALLSDARPLLQVAINGAPVRMLVDTGSTITAVTPDTVTALGLARDPKRQTTSNTIGGVDTSSNALVGSLSLANLSFANLSVAVVPLGEKGPPSDLGGLIGGDILRHFDIELDLPRRTLTFWRPAGCLTTRPPWNGTYAAIKGSGLDPRKFLFPVELNGQAVMALFDTGASGEMLARAVAGRIGISDAQLDLDQAGTGISAGQHRYIARRHRFDSLRIGDETFHDVPVDVMEMHQAGTEMLVGADYMRRRHFFLSWSTGTLFVQREPIALQPPAQVQCPPTPDIPPLLAQGQPVALTRPRAEAPAKFAAEQIEGCAGVLYRIDANGKPRDIRLIVERPPGYGLGLAAARAISLSQFSASSASEQWYYEVHRYHR